jgi:hypothetical protein
LALDLPGFRWDDWQFDESLGEPVSEEHSHAQLPTDVIRHDAHDEFAPHLMDFRALHEEDAPDETEASWRPPAGRSSAVTWSLLCFGIATLMCGGALIVWSFVGSRPALWSVGTPLALAGQAMVLIGLVLQMDVVWQASYANSHTLEELDRHLSVLQPGRTLTEHPSQHASPHLLINDLKNHLERLSTCLAETHR